MIDFNLYLITDRKISGNCLAAVEEALRGGVRAVQLREKDLKVRELLHMAYQMRELTERYGARLFINDRVDVAIAVEADGVHLGQNSIPPWAVKRIAGELLIGVSTHSLEEAIEAERGGADFITFGPVFYTPSKAGYGAPLGRDMLKKVSSTISIPVFAIGGIKPEDIKGIRDSGARGVAVISGILGARDIREATEKYLRSLI